MFLIRLNYFIFFNTAIQTNTFFLFQLELWVQCNELSSARLRAPNAPLPTLEAQNMGAGEMMPAAE